MRSAQPCGSTSHDSGCTVYLFWIPEFLKTEERWRYPFILFEKRLSTSAAASACRTTLSGIARPRPDSLTIEFKVLLPVIAGRWEKGHGTIRQPSRSRGPPSNPVPTRSGETRLEAA